jgi:membrane-associated phospholipid phosphatase
MLLLGWAVGTGPTPIDSWFLRLGEAMGEWSGVFLVFTEEWVLVVTLAVLVAVVLRRRQWRLAVATLVSPLLAIAAVQVCKRIFGREKGGELAYPSGHSVTVVVVMGLLVVVAGGVLWAVILAVSVSALGMFGQAITYHYFTDTIGAALLGTAVVCLVATVSGAGVVRSRHRPAST